MVRPDLVRELTMDGVDLCRGVTAFVLVTDLLTFCPLNCLTLVWMEPATWEGDSVTICTSTSRTDTVHVQSRLLTASSVRIA